MPFIHTDDDYKSIGVREDANGKRWIYAFAHGDLTAGTPYVAYEGYDGSGDFGWKTMALVDTTLASTTAATRVSHYVGVPDEAVSSGTWGWLQIGGKCLSVTTASITGTVGCMFRWKDASVANAGAGVSNSGFCADFAVCITSSSASTAHDMFLLGRPVCGIT